jgi:hypothetical protein
MKIIAFIQDPLVIDCILTHLGLLLPQAHSPPLGMGITPKNKPAAS